MFQNDIMSLCKGQTMKIYKIKIYWDIFINPFTRNTKTKQKGRGVKRGCI